MYTDIILIQFYFIDFVKGYFIIIHFVIVFFPLLNSKLKYDSLCPFIAPPFKIKVNFKLNCENILGRKPTPEIILRGV